jgi:hypothetical protein
VTASRPPGARTRALGDRARRAGGVHEREVGDDDVEGAVRQRQVLHVPGHVPGVGLEARVQPAGERDHRGRDVHADGGRAATGRGRGGVAGTGRDVEDAGSCRHAREVLQRLDDAGRHRREEVVVRLRLRLPPGQLERGERVGADHRRSPSLSPSSPG